MKPLRFAMLGTGFWSCFQLAGWRETGSAECVALCDREAGKAESLAKCAGVDVPVYEDASAMFAVECLDFVDIVTGPESHTELAILAAAHRLPAVCQKPMALSLDAAKSMVLAFENAGVPLLINENWRWQSPIRRLKELLSGGAIGTPYRARIRMVSAFPVFENQPALRQQERFLVLDMGSHLLDVARFLFGEAESVYCTMSRIQPGIQGEDVATVTLRTCAGATVICEMGYAGTPLEIDHFPQTFALIEGDRGSLELAPFFSIRLTTSSGTEQICAKPPRYPWANASYDVVHASIVPCQTDLLAGLRGERLPETNAADNFETMRLVFGAYDSALRNEVIRT